ncbi:MAG: biopolymer transporter ExbD [Candidatus Coatesbacteria bacterium]|nr:biopolymer transporter ExbD [Candidatus Coatesbacteria bacterium]
MKFGTRLKVDEEINSSSTADIAFLLIIFFMVTTVFGTTRGLEMTLPKKQSTEEAKTAEAVLIEIGPDGGITIDGVPSSIADIQPYLMPKLDRNPNKFVLIKSDLAAKYQVMISVIDELRQLNVKNISIPTQKEIRMWERY